MTGFGRGTRSFGDKQITVVIRSLNSKTTDIRFRIPTAYREKEAELRRIIVKEALRGKFEMNLEISSNEGDGEYKLNKALFRSYYRQLSELGIELGFDHGSADLVQAVMRIQNVVAPALDEVDEAEYDAVQQTLRDALGNLRKFRRAEGAVLEEDLRLRIRNIGEALQQVDPFESSRIDRLKQRLHQNLENHHGKDNVDENRFEQEVIYYLEKIDINEEKVRLEQHLKYFLEELDKKDFQKGRKLGFISQEIGREVNTLGAKAYSSDIQKLVVQMKDELEKIKEQLANAV